MLLRATNISKHFGPTKALDTVTVEFARGEVHALMGENGAGKSTMGKVIAGLHTQDQGVVAIDGRELTPGSLKDAFHAGIRLVHQELAQCPNLSVAENLCLHDIPRTPLSLVDDAAMIARAQRLLANLEPGINVRAPLGTLSPGHRQIVQIAASLDDANPAKVIVFDEPTSSLSIAEVDRLLAIIRQLAASGITCIYVSHRMSEIFAVCDRVTVLRDGKFVATSVVKEIDESTLVEQMIGRKVPPPVRRAKIAPSPAPAGEVSERSEDGGGLRGTSSLPALDVRNLSSPGKIDSVSLSVAPGEILGVGGLVGAGRSELLDAIFGLDHAARGTVIVAGSELCTPTSGHTGPRASIEAHAGYVPEDRKLQGLFFLLGVGENIVEPFMARLARLLGLRSLSSEQQLVSERLRDFEVKTAGPHALPGSLSGGNQQKLLLARWMGRDTRVLLLDEPTRGIDVGTKAQIYKLIREAADRGMAVLLVSSEMPELLALSDRIIVLSDGKATGELRDDAMTQASILKLATVGH
jgi:ABC-type sugar transport system ATPase subunit